MSLSNQITNLLHQDLDQLDPSTRDLVNRLVSNFKEEQSLSPSIGRNETVRKSYSSRLVVNDRNECLFIEKKDILYAEAQGAYTSIYLVSGKKVLISKNIKALLVKLDDEQFIRTHKSWVANARHISKYVKHDGGYLVMSDQKSVPVSVRKRESIGELMSRLTI